MTQKYSDNENYSLKWTVSPLKKIYPLLEVWYMLSSLTVSILTRVTRKVLLYPGSRNEGKKGSQILHNVPGVL